MQGVWFRKYTVAKAQALHLVGWCANSQRGTVVGECQGKPQDLQEMKVSGSMAAESDYVVTPFGVVQLVAGV